MPRQQLPRTDFAGIPILAPGEVRWSSDTKQLFVGDGTTNHLIGGLGDPYPTYEAENKHGSSISAGMAVAVHSSGVGVVKASAADATKPAVGLTLATVASTFSANVQTSGPVTLTDWTAVIGAATLAAHAVYFLDPATPGKLTATPPTTVGQVLQEVGVAVSATTLNLSIQPPILL